MSALKKFDTILGKVFRFVGSACFTIVLLLFLYTILLRWVKSFLPFLPVIVGSSEIEEMCLVWGVFITGAELCRTNQQIVVDFIIDHLKDKTVGKLLMLVIYALQIAFGVWVTIGAYVIISKTNLMMVYLPLSKGACYACIPVCSVVLVVYSVKNIVVTLCGWNKPIQKSGEGG